VLRAMEALHLLDPSAAVAGGPRPQAAAPCRNGAALRIWRESRPVRGTAAARYLASRGLRTDSAQLRYHPRTPQGAGSLTVRRPALIAAVADDSGVIAIHRTFVDPDGNGLAPIAAPRGGLGRFGRGAVRLGGPAPRLGLAEGIETALSATALFGISCWAALGVERFARLSLPAEVEQLLLFLDHDSGGQRAERLARRAFADVAHIEAHYPARPGDDWNDVLRRSGEAQES
jgi:putative DNA primase/helicase